MNIKLLLIPTASLLLTVTAMAGEEEAASKDEGLEIALSAPEQCISLARVDRTRIINDQTILFYMKGKKIYRNDLPHKCRGLKINDSFMYRTSLRELCNVDTITVLSRMGGALMPGPACGLGKFQPIPEGEARVLVEEIAGRE